VLGLLAVLQKLHLLQQLQQHLPKAIMITLKVTTITLKKVAKKLHQKKQLKHLQKLQKLAVQLSNL